MTDVPRDGRFVPLDLYLEDRRELRAWMTSLTAEVKAMRRELDRDDGKEVAQEAAAVALDRKHRSRGEVIRDVALATFSAALALTVALITFYLTGG